MNILKIIKFIRDKNITKSEFCQMCNIRTDILDDIIYYGKNIDYKIAEEISKVIGIAVYELYVFDYIL